MQRIKHIPTGLYYRPSTEKSIHVKTRSGGKCYVYLKSNLSKHGKVYRAATLKWLKNGYYNHLATQEAAQNYLDESGADSLTNYMWAARSFIYQFRENEWEIEEL
jgi:hypothetical protein